MNVILFDTPRSRALLRPFSYTKALAEVRVGIGKMKEKWKNYLPGDYSSLTAPYLGNKFPCTSSADNLCINSTVCPDQVLAEAVRSLNPNQKLVKGERLLAVRCDQAVLQDFKDKQCKIPELPSLAFEGPITQIEYPWDLFGVNEQEIRKDIQWISKKKATQTIPDPHTITYHPQDIYLGSNVVVQAAILNAVSGPIYIGDNVTIEAGAVINGPAAICTGARIKAGASISNATTIGPYTNVGGEVSNSVIFGYSNKAYNGFIGNSVIGAWCNMGAGTNVANLRNDYDTVKVWDEYQEVANNTNMQFCGLFMGDYSRCTAHTTFDAGTIVGVSSNLLGTHTGGKMVPSFTQRTSAGHMQTYHLDKALSATQRMMELRMVQFTKEDAKIFAHLFLTTAIYRN
jgi:UDP-N-acetylglucosamine diphosphorylase/glucosamine-1-phosphate N-acetyltransferase